jgi:hypothetical protein
MSSPKTATNNSIQPAQQTNASAAQNGIDLNALAEKIYRLLKKEARLERERLGRRSQR